MKRSTTTESMKRLSRSRLEAGRLAYPPRAHPDRPRTGGDCEAQGLGARARPCPWISCRWHMALEVDPRTGAIKITAPLLAAGADRVPDIDLAAMPHTCALRAADAGGMTLYAVGDLLRCTRERARQIERHALRHARAAPLPPDLGPADGPRGWDASLDPPGAIATGDGARCGTGVLYSEEW